MRQCSSRSLPPGESDQGRESATFGAHSRQLFAPSASCTSSARTLRSTAPSVRMPPQLQTRLTSPARYTGLMLAARGPLGLCSTSYCTLSFSFSVLNPLAWMDEKCTKRSLLPSSGVMKPKPLASLNHFTVPVLMSVSLISIGKKGAIGREAALRKIKERTNRRGQYEPLRPDQPTRCLRILLYRYTGIRTRSPI